MKSFGSAQKILDHVNACPEILYWFLDLDLLYVYVEYVLGGDNNESGHSDKNLA